MIYKSNYWHSSESISGTGSEISQTASLRDGLDKLFTDFKVTSLLDIPCGDFNWMRKLDLSKIDYHGADIVDELIQKNNKLYASDNIRFSVLDLLKDPLPKVELIFVRDCLIHLSYKDIFTAINNVKSSRVKYLLTTTYPDRMLNHDITTGDFRPINLQAKPFNFPPPILIINKNCTEANGKLKDKSMALWEIDKI